MVCDHQHCWYSSSMENATWGFYSRTEGDCSPCKISCLNDINCAGVECGPGLGYCIWFTSNQCDDGNDDLVDQDFWTCRKKIGKLFYNVSAF